MALPRSCPTRPSDGLLWAVAVLLAATTLSVVGAAKSECDKDPSSYQCLIEKDETIEERTIHRQLDKDSKDFVELQNIVAKVEDLCSAWCCAATGRGLYDAHGDKDVTNFVYTMLSQTLARNGQHYGSELVTAYMKERDEMAAMPCDHTRYGDSAQYNNLLEVVLQLKDLLSQWLRRNEVDPTNIMTAFIPQARTLYGRWGIARLLVHKAPTEGDAAAGAESTNNTRAPTSVPSEDVPLSVLPLLEGEEDAAEERCAAAAQLSVMYREAQVKGTGSTERLTQTLHRMLDACYDNGRVSAQPSTFGEHLLDADRVEQARELFDLAVQRGTLCNAYQRPDMLLRKDLSALPVWSLAAFPDAVLRGFLGIQDAAAAAVQRSDFMFSSDTETMSMFLASGWWERTIVYASHTWQEYNCQQFGAATCNKIKRLVDTISDSNDAYVTQCNGSLAIDIWRMSPGMLTHRSVGSSNIVLQLIMPIATRGNTLLLNIGEEAVKIDEGEMVVIDDSFENILQIAREDDGDSVGSGAAATTLDEGPVIVLHAQLCHPEFHERALELPAKKCKKTHGRL